MAVSRSFSLPVSRTASYAVRPTSAPVEVTGTFSAPVWVGWLDEPNHAAFFAGEPYTALHAQVGDRFRYSVSLPSRGIVYFVAWNREGFIPITGAVTLTASGA